MSASHDKSLNNLLRAERRRSNEVKSQERVVGGGDPSRAHVASSELHYSRTKLLLPIKQSRHASFADRLAATKSRFVLSR